MLRNYFIIAYRHLLKQRFYTAVNLMGLAVGLACCLLIALYVQHELSYDRSFPHADRIYRMRTDLKFGNNEFQGVQTPAALAGALRQNLPEVEFAARIRTWGVRRVRRADQEGKNFREGQNAWADPDVFDLFGLQILAGDPAKGLTAPRTVAISRSKAEQYFPSGNALGQRLIFDDEASYEVVGVYEDLPPNSHFHLHFMLSMKDHEEAQNQIWLSNNFHTYVRLAPHASPEDLTQPLASILKTYVEPQVVAYAGGTLDDLYASGGRFAYYLQPLKDVHFDNTGEGTMEPTGDIRYVYIFGTVALFILLIASINYINLTTARSVHRAREVGVRKALGGRRQQVIVQFLVESFMIVALATLLALWLVDLLLPFLNQLVDVSLEMPWTAWWFAPSTLAVMLVLGGAAGIYPAFYLSSFQPVDVFKGTLGIGGGRNGLRSGLVVFQFTTSIVLIVATVVVAEQLQFIQGKDLGFQKEQVLIIKGANTLGGNRAAYREALLALPQVEATSSTSFIPVSNSVRSTTPYWREDDNIAGQSVVLQTWWVDPDYRQVLKLDMQQGRFFQRDRGTDQQAVVLNEIAIRRFGFEGNPVGQRIAFQSTTNEGRLEDTLHYFTVIGVVQDFHFESLKDQVEPLGLFYGTGGGNLIVRLAGEDIAPVLKVAEAAWKKFVPREPFAYSFMDEEFDHMYREERRTGQIFGAFATLAILIACLGLFALSAYLAEQRSKEIGIRKVLGATVGQILVLLSSSYLRLVLLALILAIPFAWWAMSVWLESYAYRIDLSVWPFALAGLLAFLLALGTVSSQSLRVANQSPAHSLRGE